MEISRRDFLKLMATSTAGAVVFNGCQAPEREMLMQSPLLMPEDMVTGLDNWYATICRQCSAGCGIIVRVIEGKAKKIEGNPDYPVNQGKLCARGQSGLQVLYHPDRLRGPKRLVGTRGSGQYRDISWDEALNELTSRLRQLQGQGNTVVMMTEPVRGHLATVVKRFAQSYGAEHIAYETMSDPVVTNIASRSFGQGGFPDLDIQNSNYILSFGADFLGTWGSPVRYGRAYGSFRQDKATRGTLVQVEPRMSMTGASADEWLPVNPGTEGVLALSMAQVIISQGLGDSAASNTLTGGGGAARLNAFSPDEAAKVTGVPAGKIIEIARAFASHRPSIAIAGGPATAQTNGTFNASAVYALNYLVGSVSASGGLVFNPQLPLPEYQADAAATATSFNDLERFAQRLAGGQPQVNLVMVHNVNPVYGSPGPLGLRTALGRAGYIVSFSSFMDETTELADLILPDHTYLESWGDDIPTPGVGYEVVGLQQPIVNPLYDTKPFADVLMTVASQLGGQVQSAVPWGSLADLIKQDTQKVAGFNRGSVRAPNFDAFWIGALRRGGWWDTGAKAQGAAPQASALPTSATAPTFAGDAANYPYNLIPFESVALGDGQGANIPWLQSIPDPVTTMTWTTWVEINPRTAQELGIREGDVLTVESPNGVIRVPAYIHPAIPPGVVAIPIGQGHTNYGRYAANRGQSVFSILAPVKDSETGAFAWAATRVKLTKTGDKIKMPKIEGSVQPFEPEDADIIRVTPS